MTATVTQLAYNVAAAAAQLDVSTKELRRLLNSGEVSGYRTPGGHWRVAHDELANYVQRQTEQARP